MKIFTTFPDDLVPQASFLEPTSRDALWRAAVLLADSRSPLIRLTAVFGRRIEALRARISGAGERLGGESWLDLTKRAQDAVEDTLWHSFPLASFGLDLPAPGGQSKAAHRFATTASGVLSGFVGLPGVLLDIPFTTVTILRSIAQTARDFHEDLASDETRRACLEVLAFGGPSPHDDESELGYWMTRAGLNHATVNFLMKAAAGQFGIILSEKFLAQAVPVVGAASGGALNYAFTKYYQDMAQVHFTLRALERESGDTERVKSVFAATVKAARARRRITRKSAGMKPMAYLPR